RKWDSNYFFLAGGCWNYIPFSPGDSTPSCGHQDFNGAMDEVRIYTRELSETDVNYLYANPGAQGNTSNLQARWEFGGTCIDVNSGSQNVGKATYTAGTQDLNVFLWSDFIGAAQGLREDRNVTSTGGAS
ncbi:MAG TPA: hypothetical protein VJH23_03415, partial [archaeon]|nr:hypothetical protein [archaeon]